MYLNILNRFTDFDRIKQIWHQLNSVSNTSYFLSWGWIENWITSLPNDTTVKFVVFYEKDLPVIAFFLGQAHLFRKKIFRSRGLFLNTTGNPIYDELCIEYNSMFYSDTVLCSLKELLDMLPGTWDEFFMPGLDSSSFPGNSLTHSIHPYNLIIEATAPSPYVDLELIRKKGGDYLSLLSSKTRAHVRRSYRFYESHGPVLIEVASDLTSCYEIFEEMVDLHQKRWVAKGGQGAFASDFMLNFHRELIKKRFAHGEIQLLRITSDGVTLGCIYNFVYQRRVSVYQLGINYGTNKRLHPGLISHIEAIKYNAEIGNSVYDFLGGSEEYKSSLATNEQKLIYAKVQKPKIKFWIENKARSAKNSIQQFIKLHVNKRESTSVAI